MMNKFSMMMIAALAGTMSVSVPAAAQGSAYKCRVLGQSIQVRQQELLVRGEKRTKLADEVELAGDAWEAAEAVRLFSQAQAEEADAKKIIYEDLRANFTRQELAYAAEVAQLNRDVADYNRQCAPTN